MAIHTTRTLLTQHEAARQLGVSERRVSALRRTGDITPFSAVGNSVLITADSVRRYARLGSQGGRPYSARMAFGALYLLSGEDIPWLTAQQRYRLRRYLRSASSESIVRLTRRRAQMHEYWCRDSMLNTVREKIRISAATGELSNRFNLIQNGVVEGYADQAMADRLVAECRLKIDANSTTVRLHILDELPLGKALHVPIGGSEMPAAMPLGVCAADLAESDDPRERRAGLDVLARLLDDFKKSDATSK